MKTIICIDDTDNIDSKRGTGELAEMLRRQIENKGWGKGDLVVRHQLFFHPDIPYTSHNSAMSFTVEVDVDTVLPGLAAFAGNFLKENSLEGSDPGLCLVFLPNLTNPQLLIDFGREAKVKVLTKVGAYQLAEKLGVHLSEHGGTGMGVIGALAGAGLRLSGSDGRVRGKHIISGQDRVSTVKEILKQTSIDLVKSLDGTILSGDEAVRLGEKIKSVFLGGQSVLLVNTCEDKDTLAKWETCPLEYLKKHY